MKRYQSQESWAPDPIIERPEYEHLLEVMRQAGELPGNIPYEKIIRTDIAEAVTENWIDGHKKALRSGGIAMTPIDAIEIDHVTKTYLTKQDERHALGPITLHVTSGEMVAVVGPSGCGKSTLLSLIAGLMPVTSGEIRLFGEPVKGPSPPHRYMLQRDGLLEWRTVEENIALGLEIRGKKA